MSDLNLAGDFLGAIFFPGFVAVAIVGVYFNTRKRNIAYNCIGFLLLLLSVVIGAVTTFADPSIPNNFALSDWYKLIGFVSGMLGTAICAIVAFRDQAKS
ncbi:hypothetical protein ACU6D0_004536 [Vibrio alginolyticus]|nr:hypothetical protein [Vibrio alginolyticus]ELA7922281.1 hypothetical protein [Vibrio alginolyticus]